MRFERQESIPQIGTDGQKRLRNSHVAVIGAGGLGSPVLTYLACAGIGKITIIDNDTVSLSNLNRQFLYGISDIGKDKATLAARSLSQRFNDIELVGICCELNSDNISTLLIGADVILDCVDNTKTRLLVNDFAITFNIPLVEAGVNGFYGFLMTILKDTACLRCFGFDNTKQEQNIPALGATSGVIGSLQATECVKIILNSGGKLMTNRVLQYDGINGEFDEVELLKSNTCPVEH